MNSATVARRLPIAGKNSGSGPSFFCGGGNMSTSRCNGAGSNRVSRVACSSLDDAEPLSNPRRQQRSSQFVAIRKQPKQDPAMKPIVAVLARAVRARLAIATRNGSINLPYCTPDGHAVSHARQSRHNSRWRSTRGVELQPAVRHRAHQINAPAGTSFSSPVSTYVGHADVQSPQWMQSNSNS